MDFFRFFLAFATVSCLLAAGSPRSTRAADLEDLDQSKAVVSAALGKYVAEEEVAGLAVAVAHQGRIVYSEGFGWADLEQRVAVTTNTRFRLASVSKLFTAAAIAKLSEEGLIDLDRPVQDYVPSFPKKKWPTTLRQLGSHIGGIRGYEAKDFVAGQDIFQEKYPTTGEALEIFARDPLKHEPGTKYKYSTFGFTLLTAVIEKVSGLSFEEYLRVKILEPLGIHSVVPDRPESIIANRSRSYEPNDLRKIKHASFIRSDFKFGGGGLLGSAEDLARFGAGHIRAGFFSEETLSQTLFSPQTRKDGRSVHVGFAWRVATDEQFGTVYHHSGSLPGGRSVLMVWPDQNLVVAATSNTTNAPYYAEQFAQTLSHPFLTELQGGNLSPASEDISGIRWLQFEDGDRSHERLLAVTSLPLLGWLGTPPSIARELEKRKFPAADRLAVLSIYSNRDSSMSIILGSDIGLHRMQVQGPKDAAGFIVELVNKFRWEVHRHPFTGSQR